MPRMGRCAPYNAYGQQLHVSRHTGRVTSRPHITGRGCHRVVSPFSFRRIYCPPTPVVYTSPLVVDSSPTYVSTSTSALADRNIRTMNVGLFVFGLLAAITGVALLTLGILAANPIIWGVGAATGAVGIISMVSS